MNAYAVDAAGNAWIVRDDSLVQELTPESVVLRQFRLPSSLYRDIQVEAGVVYFFDNAASSIMVYRKP